MPIRDLLITAIVLLSLPQIIKRPWLGVLVWSWIGYMNPHRLTWGFAFDMPFAQIVALTLFAAVLMDKEKKSIPMDKTTFVWGLFLLWITISTIFAMFPTSAWVLYIKVVKIQIITILTMMLMTNQRKIDLLIWVIVGSIGFYSVKGGLFTLLTGGGSRVWGPPGGFIEENNSLALATLMIVPLMIYLYQIADNKWFRYGLAAGVLLSLISALGSQSRGALLAILAVSGYFWLATSHKIITAPILILLAVLGFSFMPESWHKRMETIENYDQDASAMGRINAWQYSMNVANARITGGGMQAWKLESFAKYAPNPLDVHAAHSIFFGILGDNGWPGLILFLLILWFTWGNLSWVIKHAPDSRGARLSKMIKVSLVAYCSGGAFLSLGYFDLPWHLYAIALLLRHQCIPQNTARPLRMGMKRRKQASDDSALNAPARSLVNTQGRG